MKELELKKKALAAESEVYREMLKLELRNVGLYGNYLKAEAAKAPYRLLKFVPLVAGFFARRRKPKKSSWTTAAVVGWQVYRRVIPLCRALFTSRERTRRGRRDEFPSDERVLDL